MADSDREVPRPRRRWRWPVGAVAGLLVLAAVTAVGVLVTPRAADSAFTTPAPELVRTATARLRAAPLVRYRGAYLDPAGHLVRLTGDVARSGDAVVDLVAANGGRARLVITGSQRYLRGDHDWYLEQDPENELQYDDAWTQVSSSQLVGTDLGTLLDPATIAATLRYRLVGGHPVRHPLSVGPLYRAASVAGGTAAGVPTPSAAVGYVTPQRPYRLIGVDGPVFTAGQLKHGTGRPGAVPQVSLTIGQPTGTDRKSALARIRSLGDEASSDASGSSDQLASYTVSVSDPPCFVGEPCRFIAHVRRDSSGPATPIRYLFIVVASISPGGTVLGSCQTRTRPLRRHGSDSVTCRVGGQLTDWTGSYYRAANVIDTTYYGAETDAYARLFVDNDLDTLGDLASSPEAVGIVDDWSSDPGWTVPSLADMLTTASSAGLLRPLYQLASSGAFVDDSAASTAILRAVNTTRFGRYRAALLDAAGHAGSNGQVALGSLHANDRTYRADVIDSAAHQLIAEATADSVASLPATVAAVRSAASRLHAAPDYTRVVHLSLAPGHRLYREGKAAVRDALRAAGLSAAALSGAVLSISTGTGTITLHPADFR